MDDGAISRALPATCRYLRSASTPHKHHLLRVGPNDKQITSLVGIVRGLGTRELPRVLAIEAMPRCDFDNGADSQRLSNVDQTSGDWDETVTNHLESVLRRIHDVVEVLRLDIYTITSANFKALYAFSFAHLREITLGGLHPFRPRDCFPTFELFRITVDSVNGLTLCVPIQKPHLREVHILRSKPQHGLWISMSMLLQLHPGARFVVHFVPPSPLSIGYVHSLAQYKSNVQECQTNVKVAGKEDYLEVVRRDHQSPIPPSQHLVPCLWCTSPIFPDSMQHLCHIFRSLHPVSSSDSGFMGLILYLVIISIRPFGHINMRI
jgi:hypothetical protein